MTATDLDDFASFADRLADASRADLQATIEQPVRADSKGDGGPIAAATPNT